VLGIWPVSALQTSPPGAFTPSSFNTGIFGLTRLDAQTLTPGVFLIGISDWRGDGRADYHYHAHVLYGDAVRPARVGVNGGAVVVSGTGFAPGLAVTVGGNNAAALAVGAGDMILALPAQADSVQTITISDPVSGAFSIMTGSITFGAAATDSIVLVKGTNPDTPVGTQANNPITVRAVASDGVTPVAGATIVWSASNGAALSACGGASTCSAVSDESGNASTWITPAVAGSSTLTATLAPGAYPLSKSVSTPVEGTEESLAIGLTSPYSWVAAGGSVSLPLTARVMDDATPLSGDTVNFTVALGAGTLSSSSAVTNSSGYASVSLALTNVAAQVQVSACVAPRNSPCESFFVTPVAASLLNLWPVAGAAQAITLGQPFQPVIVRVTDSASPPDPVLGAVVAFQTTVMRPAGSAPAGSSGGGAPALPVILSVSQTSVQSDANGLARLTPSTGGFSGPLEVQVSATAGTSAALQNVLQAFPAAPN
jgi:adhesin/invasin